MADIEVDTSDFDTKIIALLVKVNVNILKAVNDVATEILRLSQFEVPHDIGLLQNSGKVVNATDAEDPTALVGYNKTYAAYQHEGKRADGSHVIGHYQNGRKGKYLEDPIRKNAQTFTKFFSGILA